MYKELVQRYNPKVNFQIFLQKRKAALEGQPFIDPIVVV
jgi:hypothetical protein